MFSDFGKKAREEKLDDNLVPQIHHRLMRAYNCWIPLEEFRKLPLPFVFSLLEMIDEESKENERINREKRGK